MTALIHKDLPSATLRGRRGCRSPLYSYLRSPIFITNPNVLVSLLEGVAFDILPEVYQARTFEQAYTARQSPFAESNRDGGSRKRRHVSGQPLDTEGIESRIIGRLPKRIKFTQPSPGALARAVQQHKEQQSMIPLSTPSSITSPPPLSPCDYAQRSGITARYPFLCIPSKPRRLSVNGAQMVSGIGLFRANARRIEAFQRGNSFVWIIRSV